MRLFFGLWKTAFNTHLEGTVVKKTQSIEILTSLCTSKSLNSGLL